MIPITNDPQNVSFCGLFCGSCRRFRKGACPGCVHNTKASWCKVRTCCLDKGYQSCADCTDFTDLRACKTLENPVANLFGWIFRSDRQASLRLIRTKGYQLYADRMAELGRMALRR